MVREYAPGFKPTLKVPWTTQPPTPTQFTGTVRGRSEEGAGIITASIWLEYSGAGAQVTGTLQRGQPFPMEMLPIIPPVAPIRGGLARGARYPPGETMKPATVDTVIRARTARIRAELLVTSMILAWPSRGAIARLSLQVRTMRSDPRTWPRSPSGLESVD